MHAGAIDRDGRSVFEFRSSVQALELKIVNPAARTTTPTTSTLELYSILHAHFFPSASHTMARAAGSRAASAKPVATKEVKEVKVNGTGMSHPLNDSKPPLTRRGPARAAKKTEPAPVANGVDEESEPESEDESEPEMAAKRKLNACQKRQLVLTSPQQLRAQDA
jgi:hypothetical protein